MLNVGDKLDNYEILNLLGSGGFGRVWRAKDYRHPEPYPDTTISGKKTPRFNSGVNMVSRLYRPLGVLSVLMGQNEKCGKTPEKARFIQY